MIFCFHSKNQQVGSAGLKQANKVADGANNLITALGDPQLGQTVGTVGDEYDDQGTNDAAALGQGTF